MSTITLSPAAPLTHTHSTQPPTPPLSRHSSRPSYFRSLSSTASIPQSRTNKPRLYLGLYPRGSGTSSFQSPSNCDSFHWALVVGPQTFSKKDPGTRYHVAHSDESGRAFLYEESDLLGSATNIPLCRITLAKVKDPARLTTLLRSLPSPNSGPSETCLSWARSAFQTLVADDSCLSSYLKPEAWENVEARARSYYKRKRGMRRFTETGDGVVWDPESVATWNFWENRETCA
ncbi:uncharacterized protein AB675_7011 [Cyphellophora attinorum]|uniref:Uncharacterized protein n=1 Tax=Cyphellophora attinorum TaxID=1664694 RepID=A0A0N1HEU4_9EURO|nr:uncharacterized protein AB675_7011 [Phialophora attinorum]KPI43475.1 hypothetical protein AB675_7011 [Phialophora attinorum]